MALKAPDMTLCTRKLKCLCGQNKGTVYDASDPCEGNQVFDGVLCDCVDSDDGKCCQQLSPNSAGGSVVFYPCNYSDKDDIIDNCRAGFDNDINSIVTVAEAPDSELAFSVYTFTVRNTSGVQKTFEWPGDQGLDWYVYPLDEDAQCAREGSCEAPFPREPEVQVVDDYFVP